jgi:hypothetical protein
MQNRVYPSRQPSQAASPQLPNSPDRAALAAGTCSPLLTPAEAATYTKTSIRTLARGRAEGWGPPFVQLTNNRLAYRRADLDAWLAQRVIAGGR